MPVAFILAIAVEVLTVLCCAVQARSMNLAVMQMPSPLLTFGAGTVFAAVIASTYWWA